MSCCCYYGLSDSAAAAGYSKPNSMVNATLNDKAHTSRHQELRARSTNTCTEILLTLVFFLIAPLYAMSAVVMVVPYSIMILMTMTPRWKRCNRFSMVEIHTLKDVALWMGVKREDSEFNSNDYWCWVYNSCCFVCDPVSEPLPQHLQGLYYLDGNTRPEDMCTFEYALWNQEKRTLSVRSFFPNSAVFHSSFKSMLRLSFLRWFRLHNMYTFDEELEDAAIRFSMWGIMLPAWVAFSSLLSEPGFEKGTSYYRKGFQSDFKLQKICKVDGTRIQPYYDNLTTKLGREGIIAVFPSEGSSHADAAV